MKWSDIADKVAQIAPIAGTLLGGPAGAAVGSLIGKALGVDPTPDAISQVIMNPESALKLKELESTERQHLQAMQLQTLQAELADTQSARNAHSNSKMPAIVTGALTVICGGLLYALLFIDVPPDNREILIQSLGNVFGFWGASLAYWVGTTRSSAEKTKLLQS